MILPAFLTDAQSLKKPRGLCLRKEEEEEMIPWDTRVICERSAWACLSHSLF